MKSDKCAVFVMFRKLISLVKMQVVGCPVTGKTNDGLFVPADAIGAYLQESDADVECHQVFIIPSN